MHDFPPSPPGPPWRVLPPLSATAPARLLVFLHGAGSRPEDVVSFALSWQRKFPGATAVLMRGLRVSRVPGGHDWYDVRAAANARAEQASQAALVVADRIVSAQASHAIGAARTVLIGYAQGATLALELARGQPPTAGIVVAYAGRLASPIRPGERIAPTIHLLHGEHDTWVPVALAHTAARSLRAGGAQVTLDVLAGGHAIGQHMVVVGTTRVMQTVFQGRRRPARIAGPTLH
jgi:phospholipase/carboxylesterase